MKYNTLKIGFFVTIIVFSYMLFASINSYLPPAIIVGITVAYLYNKRENEKENINEENHICDENCRNGCILKIKYA